MEEGGALRQGAGEGVCQAASGEHCELIGLINESIDVG